MPRRIRWGGRLGTQSVPSERSAGGTRVLYRTLVTWIVALNGPRQGPMTDIHPRVLSWWGEGGGGGTAKRSKGASSGFGASRGSCLGARRVRAEAAFAAARLGMAEPGHVHSAGLQGQRGGWMRRVRGAPQSRRAWHKEEDPQVRVGPPCPREPEETHNTPSPDPPTTCSFAGPLPEVCT